MDLCLSKLGQGNYVNLMVFKKICFPFTLKREADIFKFLVFSSVFEKPHLLLKVSSTGEIKLLFQVMGGGDLFTDVKYPLESISFLILLYLLVSTRAVIGKFNGPYSPVRTAKILSWFCCRLFCDLSPSVLDFYSK